MIYRTKAMLTFMQKRMEWVGRTQSLFQGAATMLGVKPLDFNW